VSAIIFRINIESSTIKTRCDMIRLSFAFRPRQLKNP
jgi:hypothetical protein